MMVQAALMVEPREDVAAYLMGLDIGSSDREKVQRCLAAFPQEGRIRGMFFEGLLDAVRLGRGASVADRVVANAGIGYRITNSGLFPHRDFYKLFYAAARVLHPRLPLGEGMRRIVLGFYPLMFAESLPGRTMAMLLGKDPASVLGHFVDAYKIACPTNQHDFAQDPVGLPRWSCTVEPCPFYAQTLEGIATGMIAALTGVTPRFRTLQHIVCRSEQRFVFEVSFD